MLHATYLKIINLKSLNRFIRYALLLLFGFISMKPLHYSHANLFQKALWKILIGIILILTFPKKNLFRNDYMMSTNYL